jgi:hypothetical protein
MSDVPPPPMTPGYPGAPMGLRPHRGTAVLVLGILGLAVCFICGIIAWVMGNSDLREMEAGTMDPSGMGLTKAGKICGMIAVILNLIGIGITVLFLLGSFAAGVSQIPAG